MTSDRDPVLPAADPSALRRAFGTFATGVTVITVGGRSPHGMTANSFASVSLDPPLVLVCVDRSAVMHSSLVAAGRFGVSVLAAHQEDVARHFASRWRPLGAAQFDGVKWMPGPQTGAPLISGALAWFECALWRLYDGGDHSIFVGDLLSAVRRDSLDASDDAVLFFHGRFRRIAPNPIEVAS